jgi:hypothetical protein
MIIARPISLSQEELLLDNISTLMAVMTTSSAILFKGHLEISKFEDALNRLVNYCPWLSGALTVREGSDGVKQTYVVPRKEGDPLPDSPGLGYLRCEVAPRVDTPYSSATVPLSELLPTNIHIKMLRVDLAMGSLDELPIAAFKVSQFQDHFAIGYRLNHCFYDQASIVDMFVFLGHLYCGKDGSEKSPPQFQPRGTLISEGASFSSKEEFLAAAPAGYSADPMGALSFGVPLKVELIFDSAKVHAVRKSLAISGAPPLSTNDLLHAALLKGLARVHLQRSTAETSASDDTTNKDIQIFFARNMRHPLSLPVHINGDYVRLEKFACSAGEAANDLSLIELAQLNRSILSVDKSQVASKYAEECLWFRDFAHCIGAPGCRPTSTFITDKQAGVVTNWSSFPYEQIKFGSDSHGAEELLIEDAPVMTATGCFVRVTFRHRDSEEGKRIRELVVVVNTLDHDFVDALKAIAEENDGLFACL